MRIGQVRQVVPTPNIRSPKGLTYESVKLMKRPVSMNTLMKVLKVMHT